jgi:hypothetical protein
MGYLKTGNLGRDEPQKSSPVPQGMGADRMKNANTFDGVLLRGVERRAGVHARLSRRTPRQEKAIMDIAKLPELVR